MGVIFSKIFFTKNIRVLMIGLDGAGKTTVLYKQKFEKYIETVPTIGFNVETLKIKNLNITVWDMGGQNKLRQLWKHYFANTDAIIFVIDSSDVKRFPEINEEFYKMENDEYMAGIKSILIFWNKIDIQTSIPVSEFKKYIKINLNNRNIHLQECSGINGRGIIEGFTKLYYDLQ